MTSGASLARVGDYSTWASKSQGEADVGAIEKTINEVIVRNLQQPVQYRAGKEALFGFFVGAVMRATQGKANPGQVNELLKKKLAG